MATVLATRPDDDLADQEAIADLYRGLPKMRVRRAALLGPVLGIFLSGKNFCELIIREDLAIGCPFWRWVIRMGLIKRMHHHGEDYSKLILEPN